MNIRCNGEPRELPEGATVADLVLAEGLDGRRIAILVNGAAVRQDARAGHGLRPGDEVEILVFAGGG